MSIDYHTQDIHICIFPLKESSIVMMFLDTRSKRYRKFYKQLEKLSYVDKLAAVNYIVFCYSEDIYIHKGIDVAVINDKKLVEASRKTTMALSPLPIFNPLEAANDNFDLSRRNEVPNLLLAKYKVK